MQWRTLAATTTLLACTLPGLAQETAPWIGRWRQDLSRSAGRSEPPTYKRVTLRIEPAGENLRVTYDMVGVRGGRTHLEWTGRMDGRDYRVQGLDYVLTNAYRPVGARSYEIIVKVDGAPAATAVAIVSDDGRTMTVSTTERDQKGRTVESTAVYERAR
jgi:hypothetical protein